MGVSRPLATAYDLLWEYPGRWALFGLPIGLCVVAQIGNGWLVRFWLAHRMAIVSEDRSYYLRALPYQLPGNLITGAIYLFLLIASAKAIQAQFAGGVPSWTIVLPLPRYFWLLIAVYASYQTIYMSLWAFLKSNGNHNTDLIITYVPWLAGNFFSLMTTVFTVEGINPLQSAIRSVRLVSRRYIYCLWVNFALSVISIAGIVIFGVGVCWSLPLLPIGTYVLYMQLSETE